MLTSGSSLRPSGQHVQSHVQCGDQALLRFAVGKWIQVHGDWHANYRPDAGDNVSALSAFRAVHWSGAAKPWGERGPFRSDQTVPTAMDAAWHAEWRSARTRCPAMPSLARVDATQDATRLVPSAPPRAPMKRCSPPLVGTDALARHRRHAIGLIAGTGPSAGLLSHAQASLLQESMDVWALNQFFLHRHLVPRFYHLELRRLRAPPRNATGAAEGDAEGDAKADAKAEAELGRQHMGQREPPAGSSTRGWSSKAAAASVWSSNADLWVRHFDATKRRLYADTLFVVPRTRDSRLGPAAAVRMLQGSGQEAVCPKGVVAYEFTHDHATSSEGGCTLEALRRLDLPPPSTSFSRPVAEFCHASLTRVLDLMLSLAYPVIAFVGVDLFSPDHFFSAWPPLDPYYAALARQLPAYESEVVGLHRRIHGASTHPTAARGVHWFIRAFAKAHA